MLLLLVVLLEEELKLEHLRSKGEEELRLMLQRLRSEGEDELRLMLQRLLLTLIECMRSHPRFCLASELEADQLKVQKHLGHVLLCDPGVYGL